MGKFESFIGVDFWTALFVLLNTLAIFFVAKKLLFKPVHKLISDRQSEIDGMYEKANEARREADSMAEEYTQRLENAKSESDRIIKEAVSRAELKESDIIAGAKNEAQALISKARQDAEAERERALSGAKDEIASIAVSIAEKLLEKEMDAENQKRLADEFISRLGEENE